MIYYIEVRLIPLGDINVCRRAMQSSSISCIDEITVYLDMQDFISISVKFELGVL